jgi:endonuclease/exonuclease/phosphatase (EEP) superfamily protein YafD
MFKIPVVIWIANAAARLAGTHGDVTQQAEVAGWSRQTVSDHAQKVPAAIAAEHPGGTTRAELLAQNQQLRRENEQLRDWLTTL